jgi:carbon catabolite-derepressing protein kinase
MAQNMPVQKSPAASPADRAPPPKPQAQSQTQPAVSRTPSVARRILAEEAQQAADAEDFDQPRLSHVRILPTSLPYVHDQLMEQRDQEQKERDRVLLERRQDEQAGGEPREFSAEEQAATARSLKPHSRSIVDLEKLRLEPPIGHPITQQPKRSRKWQFGIRSRNQPYEAMLYLYRAIAAQGGVWDIQPVESG